MNIPFDTSETSKCCLTEQIEDNVQSLHRVSEATKRQYQALLNQFAAYLVSKGIKNFEDVSKTEIGQFLTTKKTSNTRNLYIFLIKSFYSNYLGKEKLVMQLHQKPEQETITPSELLTPDEVIALANEAGKKKDMYQVITLTLFESCARISELLELRVGENNPFFLLNWNGADKCLPLLDQRNERR